MESKSDEIVDLKVKDRNHYRDRTMKGLRLSAAEALMLQCEAAQPGANEFTIERYAPIVDLTTAPPTPVPDLGDVEL